MRKELLVQYIPKGINVEIESCIDTQKTKELINEIEKSNLNEKEKQFLIYASYRHLKFDYSNIAEYYCKASKEMQQLMENSGLLIIDVNDALQKGFLKVYEKLETLEE